MISRRTKHKRRAAGRGAVAILAMILVTSALIRVGLSASEVFAAASDIVETEHYKSALDKRTAAEKLSDEALEALLIELQERETKIKQKELELQEHEKVLRESEKRAREQIAKMQEVEAQLRATLSLANTAAEDDLARLTTVYENMKPKTAAKLFEEMAPNFAAGFISRMRPDSAALIMAGMSPQAAYSISTILAGRNTNVPTE